MAYKPMSSAPVTVVATRQPQVQVAQLRVKRVIRIPQAPPPRPPSGQLFPRGKG